MLDNYGRAGTPRPTPIGTAVHARLLLNNRVGAHLRPTQIAKLDGHYPVSLWLDFIVNRPDIDGNNAVRLVADGHSPVAVTLAEFSLTELTVIESVHFRPAIRDSIYALALFDADGVMMAWGASVARTAGFDQSISIDLPPHQIRVRRILP